MNAQDAFKLSQQNWAENEVNYLKYIVGYQSKVEDAATQGRTSCVVGTIPSGQAGVLDWAANFFEKEGYYVGFQGVSPTEYCININWKNEPLGSRPYKKANEVKKSSYLNSKMYEP
ncbi:MAG: hypothetical protein Q7R95_10570 [bacterium]|nr:hypothetical protein [bacterium]